MNFVTTHLRNRQRLKDHLDGLMVRDLMEKYDASKAMLTTGMHQALETLTAVYFDFRQLERI